MTHKILPAVVVGLMVVPGLGYEVLGQTAAKASQARQAPMPIFEKAPSWAKLPSKWRLGNVAQVSVDAQDHVWVLHRPRFIPKAQRDMAAPPVLEFDSEGNFIQGWGGPSEGFDGWDGDPAEAYDWPENEHGIHVDYKGNVWISGNACQERGYLANRPVSDDMLLKFTSKGKFIFQIGRSTSSRGNGDTKNLRMPAEAAVNPATNEVFVADGYGNRRVIVFDADTGAFKRMWGAFGAKRASSPYRCPTTDFDQSVIGTEGPGPKTFDVVHGIRLSRDGLAYVADRNYRRVQVFKLDGTYVNQVFIDRATDGSAGAVALSPDPEQQFLYVASQQIVVVNRKTLEVVGKVAAAGGHGITADSKGNIYTAHTSGGAQGGHVEKLVFKGLSTATSPVR